MKASEQDYEEALSYLRMKLAQPKPQLDRWPNAVAVLASLFVFTGVPMIWLSPDLGFYFDLLGLVLSFSGLLLLLFLVEDPSADAQIIKSS